MNGEGDKKIRIGISSCLLGNKVRFDGGHKHDRYITLTLGQYFEFVPVCPEVECGLSIPREAMRLVGDPDSPRLVTNKTGVDHTERMVKYSLQKVKALEQEGLRGFIFKSRSPSSGMERVKVYDDNTVPRPLGVGLFAKAFMNNFPLLPVEEEGRLHDIVLRENFIEAVFVYERWRDCLHQGSAGSVVTFHTQHKLLLMAHSEKLYRQLGKLVAQAGVLEKDQLFSQYQEGLMAAMKLKPTTKKHINVLQHILGYFKKFLTSEEKQEMLERIEEFRHHYIPLIVPVTLFNHFARKYQVEYLIDQYYLKPHPIELKLRNHA